MAVCSTVGMNDITTTSYNLQTSAEAERYTSILLSQLQQYLSKLAKRALFQQRRRGLTETLRRANHKPELHRNHSFVNPLDQVIVTKKLPVLSLPSERLLILLCVLDVPQNDKKGILDRLWALEQPLSAEKLIFANVLKVFVVVIVPYRSVPASLTACS